MPALASTDNGTGTTLPLPVSLSRRREIRITNKSKQHRRHTARPDVPKRGSSLFHDDALENQDQIQTVIGNRAARQAGQATASSPSPSTPSPIQPSVDILHLFPTPPSHSYPYDKSSHTPSLSSSASTASTDDLVLSPAFSSHHAFTLFGAPSETNEKQNQRQRRGLYHSTSFWDDDDANSTQFQLKPFDFDIAHIRRGFKSEQCLPQLRSGAHMAVSLAARAQGAHGAQSQFGAEIGVMRSDFVIADEMIAPPPIPARSALRLVPAPQSSDIAPRSSPALGSPKAVNSQSPTPISPAAAGTPSPVPTPSFGSPTSSRFSVDLAQYPAATRESFGVFNKKKGAAAGSKDPHKVKDGALKKSSSSGVYTPSTFPGASGPRPSHFPSHVYTPSGFSLHGARPPMSPSATSTHSSSSSQSDSTAPPHTPLSPTTRFSKTLTNFRRLSHTVIPKKVQTQERESYFIPPSTSYESQVSESHSRQSSWGPQTPHLRSVTHDLHLQAPNSYFPPVSAGLGMGIEQEQGQIRRPRGQSTGANIAHSPRTDAGFDFGSPSSPRSPAQSYGTKGRRKPVPRVEEDGVDMQAAEEKVHAL